MKKIIFIIYASVIAVTGICAMIFKESLNIAIDSLVPAGVCLMYFGLGYMLISGSAYFWGGKIRLSYMHRSRFSGGDFKYSKNSRGEGSFESATSDFHIAARNSITNKIVGYIFLISSAATIPIIFFFTLYVKWWASIAIFFASFISALAVNAVVDITVLKKARNAELEKKAAWQRELEEQKKREEMGKWK